MATNLAGLTQSANASTVQAIRDASAARQAASAAKPAPVSTPVPTPANSIAPNDTPRPAPAMSSVAPTPSTTNPVLPTSPATPPPTPGSTPTNAGGTPFDQGFAKIAGDQLDANKAYAGITGNTPKTLEEMIQAQNAERQRQVDLQRTQNQIQSGIQTTQTQQNIENLKSQQAGFANNYGNSRNDVTSEGNAMAIISAGTRMGQNIGIQQSTLQSAELQRDNLLKQAQFAQDSGNFNQAKQLRQEAVSAYYTMKQIDNESNRVAIDAYNAVNTQQRNNWNAFTAQVDNGVAVDPSAFAGIAAQLNLPPSAVGAMLQYQTGAAALIANKQLDPQVKKTSLDKMKQDLFDQVAGYNSAEAQSARHYDYIYSTQGKAAADQFAKTLSTPLNPIFSEKMKAETELTSANADLAKSQTPFNWIKVNAAREALGGYNGQSDVVLPGSNKSQYSISPSADGLSVSVGVPQGTVLGTGTGLGQCGAAVNIVTGTQFPDKFTDKLAYAQKNLTNVSPQGVTPGDIFLYSIGTYGHTGIVESMNKDGTFNVFDQNSDGNGAKSGVMHHAVTLPQNASFWLPPNAQSASQYTGKPASYNSNAVVYNGEPLSRYVRNDPFSSKPYVVLDPSQWHGGAIFDLPKSSEVDKLERTAGENGLKTLSPDQGAAMSSVEYSDKSLKDMRSWLDGLSSSNSASRFGNIAKLALNKIFQFDPAPIVFDAFSTQSINAAKEAAGGRVNVMDLNSVQSSWPKASDTVEVAKGKMDKIEKDLQNKRDTIWGVSSQPLTKPGQASTQAVVKRAPTRSLTPESNPFYNQAP